MLWDKRWDDIKRIVYPADNILFTVNHLKVASLYEINYIDA